MEKLENINLTELTTEELRKTEGGIWFFFLVGMIIGFGIGASEMASNGEYL